MNKLKTVEFEILASSLSDKEFKKVMDDYMERYNITVENFVSENIEITPSGDAIVRVRYIDGKTKKQQILLDAVTNTENEEGIIWTELGSYNDLMSVYALLHSDYQKILDEEKSDIEAQIGKSITFAFWIEDNVLKFER